MNLPYLNRYRHGEFLQYLKDILQLLSEQDLTALQLTTQQQALQPKVNAIDTAFKQSQGSEITQEIIALDNQRDSALTGIRYVISGYGYHYQDAIVNASKALLSNLDQHGERIQKLGYQEQTAVLDSIIADWEGENELKTAVTTLNLTAWLNYLKTTNTHFTARYLARVEEQASNPSDDIPKLRDEATGTYRALMAHIQAHATLGTAPEHSTLLDQISVLAGGYNQVVDNRSSGTSENTHSDTTNTETDHTTPQNEAL